MRTIKLVFLFFLTLNWQLSFTQISVPFSIGAMGESLNTFASSYPILLETSDCFVASNSIIRFSKNKKGDFVSDCKDPEIGDIVQNNLEVTIYPNPAEKIITIRLNRTMSTKTNFQIAYRNTIGVLLKKSLTNSDKLLQGFQDDISYLPIGFYLVSVISGNSVFNFKLIKN
jgi:hypothetical protein